MKFKLIAVLTAILAVSCSPSYARVYDVVATTHSYVATTSCFDKHGKDKLRCAYSYEIKG